MKVNPPGNVSVLALAGILLLWGASSSRAQSKFTLPPGCKLPFAAIAPAQDPVANCGNCGVVSTKAQGAEIAAKAAESNAKNTFCSDTSVKTSVDFQILRQMQAKPVDKNNLGDRHVLHGFFKLPSGKAIGEGSVVRLKAWVLDAHVSDCPSGEDVNCALAGFANNDIHIPLLDPSVAAGRNQDECTSVTAEMSPHFRPAAWSQIDLKTPVHNAVRVTGALFFDNSHEPCIAPSHTSPANKPPFRSSLWEIHPVYQFEVCANTDPNQCDVNSDNTAVWIPYDKWVTLSGSVTEATGQTARDGCNHPKPAEATVAAPCPSQPTKGPSKRHSKAKKRLN